MNQLSDAQLESACQFYIDCNYADYLGGAEFYQYCMENQIGYNSLEDIAAEQLADKFYELSLTAQILVYNELKGII